MKPGKPRRGMLGSGADPHFLVASLPFPLRFSRRAPAHAPSNPRSPPSNGSGGCGAPGARPGEGPGAPGSLESLQYRGKRARPHLRGTLFQSQLPCHSPTKRPGQTRFKHHYSRSSTHLLLGKKKRGKESQEEELLYTHSVDKDRER